MLIRNSDIPTATVQVSLNFVSPKASSKQHHILILYFESMWMFLFFVSLTVIYLKKFPICWRSCILFCTSCIVQNTCDNWYYSPVHTFAFSEVGLYRLTVKTLSSELNKNDWSEMNRLNFIFFNYKTDVFRQFSFRYNLKWKKVINCIILQYIISQYSSYSNILKIAIISYRGLGIVIISYCGTSGDSHLYLKPLIAANLLQLMRFFTFSKACVTGPLIWNFRSNLMVKEVDW